MSALSPGTSDGPDRSPSRRRRRRIALVILMLTVVAIAVRVFLFEDFYVATPSMEPTLMGHPRAGDRVMVDKTRFLRTDPVRWGMVVFSRPDRSGSYVKRIVGMPGDEILIRGGDVYSAGRILRKPADELERLLVPVSDYDTSSHAAGGAPRDALDRWRVDEGHIADSVVVAAGGEAVVLSTRDEITDGYTGRDGAWIPGANAVGDLDVLIDVVPPEAARSLRVVILDGSDRIILQVGVDGAVVRCGATRIGVVPNLRLVPSRRFSVSFSNVDDRVLVRTGDRLVASVDYASSGRTSAGRRSGVAISLTGGTRWSLDRLRLRRDLFYCDAGRHGVRSSCRVTGGRYFVLGDNSANSSDSREWGLVSNEDLIGAPLAIVWPVDRIRKF